jgi:hypothetical protein
MAPIILYFATAAGIGMLSVIVTYAMHRYAGLAVAIVVCFLSIVLIPTTAATRVFGVTMLAATFACVWNEVRFRRAAPIMVAVTLGAIGFKAFVLWQYSRELTALLDAHPIQSLSNRLAYEVEVTGRAHPEGEYGVDSTPEKPKTDNLVDRLESQLNTHKRSDESYRRRMSLPTLMYAHQSTVWAFELAQGFGIHRTRQLPPYHNTIEIPETSPIPLQCERPDDAPDRLDDLRIDSAIVSTVPSDLASRDAKETVLDAPTSSSIPLLTEMHLNSLIDFSNAPGFGYVESRYNDHEKSKDLTQVIGFQPHAFRSVPQLPGSAQSTRWSIHELQLVSLLKHRPPAAYVSDNLPRMDELVNARTRPLDEFEADAVSQLQEGKDLVTREGREVIRMVGSIRASRQCLECHRVDRGALLGAFVYRLHKE